MVRDESKSTEEIIAELLEDSCVVFAETNAVVKEDTNPVEDSDDGKDNTGEGNNSGKGSNLGNEDDSTNKDSTSKDKGDQPEGEDEDSDEGGNLEDEGDDSKGADVPTVIDDDPESGNTGFGNEVTFGKGDEEGLAANLNGFVWGFDNDGRMGGVKPDSDTAGSDDDGFSVATDAEGNILKSYENIDSLHGTVLIDSIGLGSDLVPYGYQQGTSMATATRFL